MRFFYSILLFFWGLTSMAQTTLSAGDIAIIHIQCDNPDDFAFVPFVNLAATTEIIFTDCGADATGFPNPCTEGGWKYTAPAGGVQAGTVIRFSTSGNFTAYSDSRISGVFGLATSGDQVLAFQDSNPGNAVDPGVEPTFLFAINAASTAFTGDPTDTNQTGLPAGLSTTSPVSALGVGTGPGTQDEHDNSVYDTDVGGSNFANINSMKLALTNVANYNGEQNVAEADYVSDVADLANLMVVLPVELVTFRAIPNDSETQLYWQTATEVNNDYFQIERSSNGLDFTAIGKVNGSGDSYEMNEYTYVDKEPVLGANFYRLKQIDFDGSFEYSSIVSVAHILDKSDIGLHPNPFIQGARLSLSSGYEEEQLIQIFNIYGQLVFSNVLGKGEVGKELDLSHLAPGSYMFKFGQGKNTVVQKIIKLN